MISSTLSTIISEIQTWINIFNYFVCRLTEGGRWREVSRDGGIKTCGDNSSERWSTFLDQTRTVCQAWESGGRHLRSSSLRRRWRNIWKTWPMMLWKLWWRTIENVKKNVQKLVRYETTSFCKLLNVECDTLVKSILLLINGHELNNYITCG